MVKLEDVARAMESSDGAQFFVDMEEDEVLAISPYDYGGELQHIFRSMEENEGRFIPIEPDLEFEYACMSAFVSRVKDDSLRGMLDSALCGPGSVRSFRILILSSEYSENWLAFRKRCFMDEARSWCKANQVSCSDFP